MRRTRGFWHYPPGTMVPPPEGELVAWLGREPTGHAGPLLRLTHGLTRLLFLPVFQVSTCGHLPPPPAILVGAPHRRMRDVLAFWLALPPDPRIWALVIGPGIMPTLLHQRFFRRIGGMLPFWRGSSGIDAHVDATRRVLASGAYLALMPEGGIMGPPDRVAEFRPGFALLAARTSVPVVPFVLRYEPRGRLGDRVRVEFLPARRLTPPEGAVPGTFAEIRWASQTAARLADEIEAGWLREQQRAPGSLTDPAVDPYV
jgi:1-acyl-sn-glycerol-3-phosphate acyltransferase